MKQEKISDKIYQILRSTGSQPLKLYRLAKTHKKETTRQLVLSIPGNSYQKFKQISDIILQKAPGANIETSTQNARKALESLILEDDEQVVSLDVKSLYINVPVGEAKKIALRELYSSNLAPDISSSAKKFVKACSENFYFKSNGNWYIQSDGLAMRASLAVILANVWMKSFEASLQRPEVSENITRPHQNGMCKDCNRRVTFRERGIEYESCKNWFHSKCRKMTNEEYAKMQEVVWI